MTDAPATPEATARARAIYDLGPTVIFSCKADPRFQYCLYVPPQVGQAEDNMYWATRFFIRALWVWAKVWST